MKVGGFGAKEAFGNYYNDFFSQKKKINSIQIK